MPTIVNRWCVESDWVQEVRIDVSSYRVPGQRGVSADVLIREAIERAVYYDAWFVCEVEKGLAQIDAGQVLTHDAIGARLEQKLTEHQSRR